LKVVKRRYLAVSIDSQETVCSRDFIDAVWASVSRLFGEYGASQAGLSLIDFDAARKLAVVRTGHKTLDMVRTALASVTQIGKKPVALHVLAVSGTIKTLHKRLEERLIF
jgi:RNase P/RNase MRP subunit POP5